MGYEDYYDEYDEINQLVTELQQEKNELIKWLKEEAETYRFRENYEDLSMTGACEMILEKLGE